MSGPAVGVTAAAVILALALVGWWMGPGAIR
jgi:hypothetical protein